MKLGEALAQRADLQKRMAQVKALLLANATTQEGDVPPVTPAALLDDFRALVDEHEAVVRLINRTNMVTALAHEGAELTLADAVVRRERLAREAGVLRELASAATPKVSRFLRTEIRHVPTIDVAAVLQDADRLSRAHRELDNRIQQKNWEAELIE